MTPIPILAMGGAVGALCAWLRCRRSAAFLVAWVAADGARLIFAPLRAGAELPYEGGARLLWMLCEVVPMALPPAALLFAAARLSRTALGAFAFAVAVVAASYPALRGQQLIGAWATYYALGYIVAATVLVEAALRRRSIGRDDLALVALALTGLASVAVVAFAGPAAWWAVTITYGAGLVGASAAALGYAEPRG